MSEWICAGRRFLKAGPLGVRAAQQAFGLASAVLRGRVPVSRWVRYRVHLAQTPEVASDVHLTPLTDTIVRQLRTHADRNANQFKSGMHFWELGLRRAYIWMSEGEPLCMQWLLTSADSAKLGKLDGWAGMYPPLGPGLGQVENLFAFSGVRRKGVATNFEHGLFQVARELGLKELVTHIHEDNAPARGWADRTGWTAYGYISRYQLELPFARGRCVFVHDEKPVEPLPQVIEVRREPAPAHR